MKIYVASSWRNEYYPEVVQKLRDAGFDVYDFIPEKQEPELMYKLFDGVACTIEELIVTLNKTAIERSENVSKALQ